MATRTVLEAANMKTTMLRHSTHISAIDCCATGILSTSCIGADALAQQSADLKKLADAWQPLYATLSPDQKRRMAFLTVFVLREVRSRIEQRLLMSEDWDDE
jgi:hypothetical protein